jgi:hypothetical protein
MANWLRIPRLGCCSWLKVVSSTRSCSGEVRLRFRFPEASPSSPSLSSAELEGVPLVLSPSRRSVSKSDETEVVTAGAAGGAASGFGDKEEEERPMGGRVKVRDDRGRREAVVERAGGGEVAGAGRLREEVVGEVLYGGPLKYLGCDMADEMDATPVGGVSIIRQQQPPGREVQSACFLVGRSVSGKSQEGKAPNTCPFPPKRDPLRYSRRAKDKKPQRSTTMADTELPKPVIIEVGTLQPVWLDPQKMRSLILDPIPADKSAFVVPSKTPTKTPVQERLQNSPKKVVSPDVLKARQDKAHQRRAVRSTPSSRLPDMVLTVRLSLMMPSCSKRRRSARPTPWRSTPKR